MNKVGVALLLSIVFHRELVLARRLVRRTGMPFEPALNEILAAVAGEVSLRELVASRQQAQRLAEDRREKRTQAVRHALALKNKARQPDVNAWQAWFDGSAQPNPGRIGIGGMLRSPDGREFTVSKRGGEGDSNQAEYMALISILHRARDLGVDRLTVYGDSQIVIGDALGISPVQPQTLRRYQAEARQLMAAFASLSLKWIPRARNTEADAFARQAHDLP